MAILSKDQIMGVQDVRTKEVAVPEWGGSVLIRTLSAGDKGRLEQKMTRADLDYSTVMAEYASLIVCDEEGKRIFSAKDIAALSEKSASALQKIFDAGQELNSLSRQDIEAIAGNS